jgi:hypothetical protein
METPLSCPDQICDFSLLHYSHSCEWKVISLCGFDLYVLNLISLLAICMFSLEKYLFKPLSIFLSYKNSLCIVDTRSLSDVQFANVFYYVGCLFTFLIVFCDAQKLAILTKSNLPTFSFVAYASCHLSRGLEVRLKQ